MSKRSFCLREMFNWEYDTSDRFHFKTTMDLCSIHTSLQKCENNAILRNIPNMYMTDMHNNSIEWGSFVIATTPHTTESTAAWQLKKIKTFNKFLKVWTLSSNCRGVQIKFLFLNCDNEASKHMISTKITCCNKTKPLGVTEAFDTQQNVYFN